jgi:hypothetical protein
LRAVAYICVSDVSQVEGHSLDAQERLFGELCKSRGWEPVGVYREEGRSAHNFEIRQVKAGRVRPIRGSRMGSLVKVPAHTRVGFKAGKNLKLR